MSSIDKTCFFFQVYVHLPEGIYDNNWLVVWNIGIIFPYIGNVIIPINELHHFSEG